MSRNRKLFRPVVAAAVAVATGVAYVGISVPVSPAQAADAETTSLLALFDGVEAFVPSLAGVGALGLAVPTLGTVPGSPEALGLADVVAKARSEVLNSAPAAVDDFDGATTVGQFVDRLDGATGGLGNGRTATFTATETAPGAVAVTMTVTRAVAGSLDVTGDVPIGPGYPPFSFASSGGVDVSLDMTLSFVMNYVPSTVAPAWLSAPSLSVGVDAALDSPINVPGGIGILGIKLGPASTLALDATVTAAFEDPNSDGKLYFDEPGGASTSDGELSAAGAGAGLVTTSITDGEVDATLDIKPGDTSVAIALPSVSALVTVDGDLVAGDVNVTYASGAFDNVRGFLTLSTRDLAQGLASAATTVMGLQDATGVDLPFMRGDYANAVGAVAKIAKYLETAVPAATPASPKPGLPTFASLQQLLGQLEALTGADEVSILNAAYAEATKKVKFEIKIVRSDTEPAVDLNPVGATISGTAATFTNTTLVDATKTFDVGLIGRQVVAGTSSGVIQSVSGSTLTLSKDPVTPEGGPAPTPDVRWVGGKPALGSSYSIAAADPKIGAVELGNALEDKASGAITNANAKLALAKVSPGFELHLPIVLDLKDPNTTDCSAEAGVQACPYSSTVDGITQIVTSFPVPSDRVKLDVDGFSLTADADITTAVDVEATVGFLGVKVKGSLKACTVSTLVTPQCGGGPRAPTDHLLSLGLQDGLAGTDADGDIPFSALVGALTAALDANTPASVLDLDVNGRAYALLEVEVPGAPAFFGGAPKATVEVKMPDITDPETFTVTPGSNIGDLGSFDLDTDNPLALFGALLADLQAVQGVIGDFPGAGALDTSIPLVGRSFNEVIGAGAAGSGAAVTYTAIPAVVAVPAAPPTPAVEAVPAMTVLKDTGKTFGPSYVGRTVRVGSQESQVFGFDPSKPSELVLKPALVPAPAAGTGYTSDSELQGLINTLQDASSPNLQAMLATLAEKLGAGSAADFEVLPGSGGAPDVLKLKLDWKRSYVNQAPMDLKFDFPSGTSRSLIGAQGSGVVTTTATGEIKLALLVPLDAATLANPVAALKIKSSESSVKAGVSVNGDGIRFKANLGPFKADIGNPVDPAGTELRAGLGVSLTSDEAGDQTLAAFVGGLDLGVTGAGATCGGVTSGVPLALCAKLPLLINGSSTGTTPDKSNIEVRLPLDTSSLSNTLNPLGAQVDGKDRVILPDNLSATLAAAALSLLSFGDGFAGYLEFAENALRASSFEGKLPLIGKDLQAGADFLGEVRTDLEPIFAAAPTNTTAGAIRSFAKTELKNALPTTGPLLTVDVTCANPMQSASAPGVTKAGTGTGTSYRYKIAAYTLVDGVKTFTPAGPESAVIDHKAALDGTDFIKVAWAAVTGATGYVVLRKVGGGDFLQIHDAGNTLAHDDKGASAGTGFTDAPPGSGPCPDSTPANEVTGFTLALSIGQGKPTLQGCVDDPSLPGDANDNCLTADIPLDLGIPGLSLKATDATDPIQAKVGWRLDLKLGFTRAAGFYVDTQEGAAPEFIVGAELDVPDLDAQLAFLNITQTNNDTTTPEFLGTFSVDLHDTDGQLALDQILSPDVSDVVTAKLKAAVDIDWHLAATVGSGAALPGISTDFALTWAWANADPSAVGDLNIAFNNVKLDAGEFLGAVIRPIVEQVVKVFKPVQPVIDTLFERVPVLSDLAEAVGGDPITIASLAETFSTLAGGPDLQPFLDVLKNIRDLVKALDGECPAGTSPCLDVGDFELVASKAVSQDTNPATAEGLIDTTPASGYNKNAGLLNDVDAKAPGDLQNSGADEDHAGFTFPFLKSPEKIFGLLVGQDVDLVKFDSGPLTLGFEFQKSFGPVYAPPPVNIVVGGGASVTLRIVAGFDTYGIRTAIEKGKADVGILDSLFFYTTDDNGAPIPVVQFEGYLQAGASISLVVIEVGVVGGVKLTISFYWNDPNNDGKFRFSEFLAAALNNPICLFNVGGELSLFIKVFITLGISPFSVSFDFTLVEVVLLEFNLKPNCTPPPPKLGGVKGDTLYLFAGKFGDKAQRAPGFDGDYPFTNASGSAEEKWVIRQHKAVAAVPAKADPDGEGGESAQPAKSAEDAKIVVTALGISEEFPDPSGNTILNIVLDGDPADSGKLSVTFNGGDKDTPFSKNVVVRTAGGADNVRTGIGSAVVDTAGGGDQVATLERTDLDLDPAAATTPTALVSGGPGADSITVGNGKDTVLGDKGVAFAAAVDVDVTTADDPATKANEAKVVSLSGILPPTGHTAPADPGGDVTGGDIDQISAGLGGSKIYGNDGDDKIGTANDNPKGTANPLPANPSSYKAIANTIVGGRGSDRIKSGSAGDTIYTGSEDVIGENGPGDGDDAGHENSVDTGTGSDTVYGSNAKDYVTTHSLSDQVATVFGGDANDVIIGGLGKDKLYGGPANDYLVAGPATVSSDTPVTDELSPLIGGARRITQEPIEGTPNEKLLVGGGGRDRIYGVHGPAEIYGDHTGVECKQLANPVSKEPEENPVVFPSPLANRDAADLILGGEGVDKVNAGGGDDFVKSYGEADAVCGSGGIDTVFGGNQDDLVYGGSGNDKLYGENDDDDVFGNTGNDSVFGNVGLDLLEGNAGSDFITGGANSDLVIGGTSKAGEPDAGDQLFGDEGTDTVIGDNADGTVITTAYPEDLETAAGDVSTAGTDYVYGGSEKDKAYGGLERDFVYGGTGEDELEGNGGNDDVYGEAGQDDMMGGSSQIASGVGLAAVGRPDGGDNLYGGLLADVITGDNAILGRAIPTTPITQNRTDVTARSIRLLDLGYSPTALTSGSDLIHGGDGNDTLMGQDVNDAVHGDVGQDYAEGGQANDVVYGEAGQDDLVGGSHVVQSGSGQTRAGQPDLGDTVYGGGDEDVVIGDNGHVLRGTGTDSDITQSRGVMTPRLVEIFDLGDSPLGTVSGADYLLGEGSADVILGQRKNDRITGGAGGDYAEGGPESDWVEGNADRDDLIGGSSTLLDATADSGRDEAGQQDDVDFVWGGEDDDLILGDNAIVDRLHDPDELTVRLGTNPSGALTTGRFLRLLDLGGAEGTAGTLGSAASRAGGDYLSGQDGNDVLIGQDESDRISGGGHEDYVEGHGDDFAAGAVLGDVITGDDPVTLPAVFPVWPGTDNTLPADDDADDGQDDLIGGKSESGYRDGGDLIRGNGESDFVLADNGTAVRKIVTRDGVKVDEPYSLRFDPDALPTNAAKIREKDSDASSTRFCPVVSNADPALATCERAAAFGPDTVFGDGGDDFLYGQDGGDTIRGGDQDDDVYGELGADFLFGDAGDDAILGDRGGVRDRFEDGSNTPPLVTVNQVPQVEFQAFPIGSVTRIADLLNDVNGDDFLQSGFASKMPLDGIAYGGIDRIRGGLDDDVIHAGLGDDLANGDSGGDTVFGDDGADVLWGGKGCDEQTDSNNPLDAGKDSYRPYCFPNGVFDEAPHKSNGETIPEVTDYLFGGRGATSGPSLDKVNGSLGSDILDWRPRGLYTPKQPPAAEAGCTLSPWPKDLKPAGKKGTSTTIDPCSWFEMTNTTDDVAVVQPGQAGYGDYIAKTLDNQHHAGIDWQYGGWDRDILQGDVADNGPNDGDRLLDWNGAYNLYTHCNAAYGGFNDVRQHAPSWQLFLQDLAYGLGAGQKDTDARTAQHSAYTELALVYPGETAHGSGSAFPATPGHFDNPNACAP